MPIVNAGRRRGDRGKYLIARLLLALAVSAALGLSSARADSISQTLAFRLNANLDSSVLNFDPFDSGLGTLESVGLTFDATRRHAWGLWNISSEARSVDYDVFLTNTTLTLDANTFGFADLHYGPGTTPILPSTSILQYLSDFSTGSSQFLLGGDPAFVSAFQPGTNSTSIAGAFLPSSFSGELHLAYSYDPGIFSIASEGFLSGSLVDVAGNVTVTYTYRTTPVPDSAAGLALATVMAALVMVGRRRLHPVQL